MATIEIAASPRLPHRLWREVQGWSASLRIGGGMMLAIVIAGLLAPLLTPYDPYYQDYNSLLLPPSWAHPLGTDMNGRDILARVLFGIRIDLQIGFITTIVPLFYGVVLGAVSGYIGGKLD